MGGSDGQVVYKVVINDNNVVEEAEKAGKKAGDGVERGAGAGASGFKEMMIGAARKIGEAFVEMSQKAVQAVGDIAKAGIDFNAKMEKYQTGFKTLLGSEEEAASVMTQIREDAARTPFDVDSLTQATQMLVSAGISADDARGDVLNLANAIAATGGGSAELSRMAANMQQVKNVGKATAMDIRQFAMAGINIYGLLADATGKSTEEVKDMEVSYELLSEALEKAASSGGMYAGAMEAQSRTFSGQISTLKDNATQLAGVLTEDLFNTLSSTGLPMVMDWVAKLLEAAQNDGIEGALEAAGNILDGLLSRFVEALPDMLDMGLSLLESLLSGIGDNLPFVIAVVENVLLTILDKLIEHLPDLILAGFDLLIGLANGLFNAIPDLVGRVPEIIGSLVSGLLEHLPDLIAAAFELMIALGKGLIQSIPDVVSQIPKIIGSILQAFEKQDWGEIGRNIVSGLWNGILGLADWLQSKVSGWLSSLWGGAKSVLGIASPSKKFAYIGEMTMLGMEEGMEDQEIELTRVVHDIYSHIPGTAEKALRPISEIMPTPRIPNMQTVERSVSYNLSATGTVGGATIVVPLTLDGREIARATAWSMGEQLAWEEM